MVTCDQQEKVLTIQKVLLWIFLQIRHLICRYVELNHLLVGFGLIQLNIELQQNDRTVCCGQNTVSGNFVKKLTGDYNFVTEIYDYNGLTKIMWQKFCDYDFVTKILWHKFVTKFCA